MSQMKECIYGGSKVKVLMLMNQGNSTKKCGPRAGVGWCAGYGSKHSQVEYNKCNLSISTKAAPKLENVFNITMNNTETALD